MIFFFIFRVLFWCFILIEVMLIVFLFIIILKGIFSLLFLLRKYIDIMIKSLLLLGEG